MKCAVTGTSFAHAEITQELCTLFGLPLPEISMAESMRRTLAHRNTINIFKRTCDLSGKAIISNFPPDSSYKVFGIEAWFSDAWDPLDFGVAYSPTESFFKQFQRLQQGVPVIALENQNCENADYCNIVIGIKDSYLAFRAHSNCRDIYCSYNTRASTDVYYSLYTVKSEKCLYGVHNKFCYDTIGCEYCFNSSSCYFCFSLEGCQNCLFSSNLKNKQYYLYNKAVTKKEFLEFKSKLNLGNREVLYQAISDLKKLRLGSVSRANYVVSCEDCQGNELARCKNCLNCFNGSESQDLADCISFAGGHNNARCFGFAEGCSYCFDCHRIRNASECAFMLNSFDVYDCMYCMNMYSSKHCFGCVGLRNKEYCILNKQYAPSDYKKLRQEIISRMRETPIEDSSFQEKPGEFGHFFPAENSYFEYNLSAAQMYWPLPQQSILQRGYGWYEFSEPSSQDCPEVPRSISQFDPHKDGKALRSLTTGRTFNILPKIIKQFQEYAVYPILEHPIEYLERRASESSYLMLDRTSSKSGIPLRSTFSEEVAPRIYSDEEYNNEFY